jgi:hypothetical protein
MPFEPAIAATVRRLAGPDAQRALAADAYWPKWDHPWWQMLALHEMGRARDIPRATVDAQVEALERIPLKIFPIHAADLPEGVDPYRGSPCHCQLGTVYQVLHAAGVDVDARLPWIRPWLIGYQMADGGMSCDNDAYLVEGECPSSMVGTIGAFEAIVRCTERAWTPAETRFLDRAAAFLLGRELRLGSSTRHNAAERESAKTWLEPCFPRFYLYDVLRGLAALTEWAERAGRKLPERAVREVVAHLRTRFPDGRVRLGRRSFEGLTTLRQLASGEWARKQPAGTFPLLEAVSVVGDESPFLTRQWAETEARLARVVG